MNPVLKRVIQVSIINFSLFTIAVVLLTNAKSNFNKAELANMDSEENIKQEDTIASKSTTTPKPTQTSTSSPTKSPTPTPKPSGTRKPTPTPTPAPKKKPMDELTLHNKKSDCWILYAGNVYNITSYFGSHPGGDAALVNYCGKDATAAFDTKDKNPPSPHSNNAKKLLSGFLVK